MSGTQLIEDPKARDEWEKPIQAAAYKILNGTNKNEGLAITVRYGFIYLFMLD